MSRCLPFCFAWLLLAFVRPSAPLSAQESANQDVPRVRTAQEAREHAEKLYRDVIEPVFKRGCYACHGDKKATAGLNLQALKPDFTSSTSGELWQRVYERVRDREMPPRKPGEAAPPFDATADANRRKFVQAIGDGVSDARRLRDGSSWVELKSIASSGDDSPTLRLRKQIRNNAAQQVSAHRELYRAGRITLDTVLASERTLSKAELDLASTAEQRIAILKQALDSARIMEDIVYTHFELETVDLSHVTRAKQLRLEAQLQLHLEMEKK
jgi:hypothetical protein